MHQPAKRTVWLLAILALEVAIYAPNFTKFFCGDSLFYLSRVLEDWVDVVAKFRSPDGLGQYRPLTYVLYSYVIYPTAGLDLFRNHLFPLLFHMANTVLAYFIARHIFTRSRPALLAAFFFGVSTVGAYISYDNTFIPDYLYVFFYLGALLSLCRGLESNPVFNFVIALVLFLFALFSKEAAVTFAAGALMVLLLANEARRLRKGVDPKNSVPSGRVRSRPGGKRSDVENRFDVRSICSRDVGVRWLAPGGEGGRALSLRSEPASPVGGDLAERSIQVGGSCPGRWSLEFDEHRVAGPGR